MMIAKKEMTVQDHACIALTTGFMMGEGVRARPDARLGKTRQCCSALAQRKRDDRKIIKERNRDETSVFFCCSE